jgi:succinate dehydrogenase/fumarate reductase flavoprotein subunit
MTSHRITLLVGAMLFGIAGGAQAAGDITIVRDLAGRVGPVIGSAQACRDIARPRIQTIIDKFSLVIREASSNEAERSDLTQTFDRTVHKGDLTGIEIISRLAEQVWARGMRRLEEHRALDFIAARDGALAGVAMIDVRTGEPLFVQATAVLLATGGGPTMYRFHTPSGDKSCDGLAMALRAGLPLRDMEMVQFHPTGLLAGAHTRMTGTVLEEGLRGAGGFLQDGNGRRNGRAFQNGSGGGKSSTIFPQLKSFTDND